MDLQTYISSGNLEQYVLGELSFQEQLEVEYFTRQYPILRQELNIIDTTLHEIANTNAIVPILSEGAILHAINLIDEPSSK